MIERQVYDNIHSRSPAPQAIEIVQVASMNLRAYLFQLLRAGLAARQSAHLVPRCN